ncbi:hypothetical protein DWV00_19990 [Trinickia dinghuensis]|uniref:ATP-dependent helicase HrpA n=1 Tax=Trinickia dinghuensis TaxID=2291023 RepID=A0A3D8JWF9_9BURK|nr:hypothetical protein DWV00_19990 [Trinickia dinghuensis]
MVSSLLSGANGSADGMVSTGDMGNKMQGYLKQQQEMQVKTMEMQTAASMQKMMADTMNSISNGELDSGSKVQNASAKAAQGIQF